MPKMRWFDRSFVFDFPVWMYDSVLERLRGTPARLEDRLRGLPQETLTRRDGDRWSIQEHAGHLLDLSDLDLKRVKDYKAGASNLSAADLQNRKTHEANYNGKPLESILSEFRKERAEFVKQLDALDESMISRSAIHPRLQKPMRLIDFAFFMAEHDDHHMACITELLRTFGEK
jgi:uncharacterized damage-inducible protein DinB